MRGGQYTNLLSNPIPIQALSVGQKVIGFNVPEKLSATRIYEQDSQRIWMDGRAYLRFASNASRL